MEPSGTDPCDSDCRPVSEATIDIHRVRQRFPALSQSIHGKPLIYLDNAASSQRPQSVLDALDSYYRTANANVHRGAHTLGDRSTALFEKARERVRRFVNAASDQEIVFVRGATEAINLVAQSFGRRNVVSGDEVIVTCLEHHANIVPWQLLCAEKGAALKVVPITDQGELRLDVFESMLSDRTRIVAVGHVSNALGTVNPIRTMIDLAHRRGIPVLIDGAQAVSHLEVDVTTLDCDFYAFSGHKVYGPMGIGVLYGKLEHLRRMPPWQGGGDMVQSVSFNETTYSEPPHRFEAGTPDVAGAVGLAAALEELDQIGRKVIRYHEARLLQSCLERLRMIPGIRLVGEPAQRAAVVSFVTEDRAVPSLEIGTRLNLEGIAVRTGHHCCQPLMQRLRLDGTIRVSFAVYNSLDEVERLAESLGKILGKVRTARPSAIDFDSVKSSRTSADVTGVLYPDASAIDVERASIALSEELDDLDGWAERYEYLIEIGRRLPTMPDELKTEANRVRGCQSTVFLSVRTRPGTAAVVEFLADSDGEIVRGLIAVLQRLFSGQTAEQLIGFDLAGFLERVGLSNNLTTSRRNGLAEMIKRLRGHALSVVAHRSDISIEDTGLLV